MHPSDYPSRGCVRHGIIKRAVGIALAATLACAWGQSGAGHSVGHYPSYYPDEIRIEAVDPAAAGKVLIDETLHAYVGAVPEFTGPLSGHVKSAKSLGSFLILSFNSDLRSFRVCSRSLRSRSRHHGGAR